MRTRILQYFNMIEVALAIAVIAIGLSSIMVLFPVGLNASSAATTDNNIPDAAEYMLSYLEGAVISSWRDASGNAQDSTFVDNYLVSSIPSIGETPVADDDGAWTNVDDNGIKRHSTKGYFRFLKTVEIDGVDTTDFAVDALVWWEPAFARYVKVTTNEATGEETYEYETPEKMPEKAAIELCMELSWPVTQPYSMREKRLYRLTLLNPAALPTDLL